MSLLAVAQCLIHLIKPLTPLDLQVRGHMHNPVAWQMWTPETLALAKKSNRLLFVSIGYAACHCTLSSCPSAPGDPAPLEVISTTG